MSNVMLNNGVEMPQLGFGVYQITDQGLCEQCVVDALTVGYRSIDTAAAYLNEEAVGRGVRRSGVPRDEVFITTKLWIQDAGYDSAKKALDKSLARLGMDYVDLYLIHQPFGDVYGAWRAMEEMCRAGKTRAVGVCNFSPDRLVDLMAHNEMSPALNQVETSPFCQQTESFELMKKHHIHMESWAPFAEGRNNLFQNKILLGLAEKYNRSAAQIVLRWLIQRDVIVIPKTVHKERMAENFNVFDFTLSSEDMALVATLDTGKSCFFSHTDPEIVKWLGGVRYDI